MAVRYSGDAEVRLSWRQREREVYATVTDGRTRYRATVRTSRPTSPEDYDRLALFVLLKAVRSARRAGRRLSVAESRGRPTVSRTFVAPCPIG